MQTESIAALAASAAAVLGVPAALLVGFRQARAARHAAELTTRSAHDHVRRQARRDAAVEFIIAVEKAKKAALLLYESDDPVEDTLMHAEHRVPLDVSRPLAVIRIEGPDNLVERAQDVDAAMANLTVRALRMNRVRYARSVLQHAAGTGNEGIAAALAQLTEPAGTDEQRTEAWQTVEDAGLLTRHQLGTLRQHWQPHATPHLKPVGIVETSAAIKPTLDAFIAAVRMHLDEPPA
ncbi:hypothetical protein [Streptomyces sp. DH10]|uniref:hypothetical protein n=1 Tax=Streptomyces sp. DH10 TaxID=3040121 RepID=UPI002441F2DB|nr:hypothetical protein [Streptomyces sp. DH10]MDG9712640.1 hypothetical protein [Streptomyces sp. DH10]